MFLFNDRSFHLPERTIRMKLKFKNQDFQTDATNAVVDLFVGQENTHSTFSVDNDNQTRMMNDLGFGNVLHIDSETLEQNMHTVQKRNNLPLTELNHADSKKNAPQFCIEMETGTGKTYVYTKTIFGLCEKDGVLEYFKNL